MSTEERPPIITESKLAFLDETTPKPTSLQSMGTWRDQLEVALRLNGESLADVVSTTFSSLIMGFMELMKHLCLHSLLGHRSMFTFATARMAMS